MTDFDARIEYLTAAIDHTEKTAHNAGTIPDPFHGPGQGIGICPWCTRAGKSAEWGRS